MRILTIHTSYNELPLLRYKYEHCKKNGLDLFIIDNMSTDGTEEFLKKNNIPRSFVDTNNTFDLRPLLYAMDRKIHELKPDWFIYSGVDMFPEAPGGIRQMIEDADQKGFTKIEMNTYTFEHTSEHYEGNPFCNYFFFRFYGKQTLISKYDRSVHISPDTITRDNSIVKLNAGIFFEMHAHKLPSERMETLSRRQAAWNAGLNHGYGTHYIRDSKINFTYKKQELTDIRLKEEFYMYKRLQQLICV